MIKKAVVLTRLRTLIGKELSSSNLHEALFCEEKHQSILRRFHAGTNTYVTYKLITEADSDQPPYAIISVPGNPQPYLLTLMEKEGKYIIQSEPKIRYSF
ncbi:hypothetical protein ACERII_05660 [Evansella sp. AB-rgal1]|uniref:hypothetical protein n=1 Tax=Evansella sp. AB-rgal1 TaxID=3242696 RepID=UPI00359E78C6